MSVLQWFEIGVAGVAIAVGVAIGIHRVLKGKKMTMLAQKEKLQFPTSCFWQTHTRVHETLTEL